MTEAEWLVCRDPGAMVAHLWTPRPAKPQNARRLRLFGCACVRAIWPLLRQVGSREAVEVAERYADGNATNDDLWAARRSALVASVAETFSPYSRAAGAAEELTIKGYNGGSHPSYAHVPRSAANAWAAGLQELDATLNYVAEFQGRQAQHADWLRDIFGNPFQPITFSPEWRTDTAIAIARAMYESREFDGMPILADALQDAGCDNEVILNHCRDGNQTHHRGCWVVDLVLGRE